MSNLMKCCYQGGSVILLQINPLTPKSAKKSKFNSFCKILKN